LHYFDTPLIKSCKPQEQGAIFPDAVFFVTELQVAEWLRYGAIIFMVSAGAVFVVDDFVFDCRMVLLCDRLHD